MRHGRDGNSGPDEPNRTKRPLLDKWPTRLDSAACDTCLRYARKLTIANAIALGICFVVVVLLVFANAIAGPGVLLFAVPAVPVVLGIAVVNVMGIIGAINLALTCGRYRRAAVLLALSALPGLLLVLRVASIPD